MPRTPDTPTDLEALRAQILETENRLDRLGHALQERRHALKARIDSVGAPLKAAGLDTPEAIEEAFQKLDASEREELLRQARQESTAATTPGTDKKQRVRFGRTV